MAATQRTLILTLTLTLALALTLALTLTLTLTKAAALNGQEGVVCSFNADGKRRFGLRLKDGKHP